MSRPDYGINLVIGQDHYEHLNEGNIYHDRFGAFQELPECAKLWIFPPESRGEYGYMLEDMEFYSNLSDEKREVAKEKLSESK